MADWKQITARIRRARTGKDPVGQLSSLYEKTRDAMVAFELARVFETSGQNSDAAKWYVAAAERFRRSDWKTKAQEAAVRLGADISAAASAEIGESQSTAAVVETSGSEAMAPDKSEPAATSKADTDTAQETDEAADAGLASSSSSAKLADQKRRRRGRRGGRNRRRSETRGASVTASTPPSSVRTHTEETTTDESVEAASEARRPSSRRAAPVLPVESQGDYAAPAARGRSGDPGLSSRLSALEMQLRRLLSCSPAKLSDADHAPAGPGVLLLTDSDLTSYYYVEPCQTLRIAVGNLLRGNASRRGADSIKPRLAEHLGIPETRVAKYLTDHCVVRWLQLDDGASHFAHFAVAVLRPSLNE